MRIRRRRKFAVTRESGFTIRHLGEEKFFVDIRKGGLKARQMFKDLDSAKIFCEQQAKLLRNEGLSGFTLTERQKRDAGDALSVLKNYASLAEAAKFWIRHNKPGTPNITFKEMSDRYVADMEVHNRRPTSLRTAKDKCRIFGRDFGARKVISMTREDIERWLASQKFSPAYRNIFLRYIKAIFNYAVDAGHIEANPAARLKKVTLDQTIPKILPVAAVEALMKKADETYPRLIPYLAIGFFAGLRPSEVQGLKWRDIDLETGHIRVMPEVAKTRRSRLVEISANLKAWLEPRQGGPDAPVVAPYMTMRRWRADLADDCGLEQWPQDIMRHCFATYHLAVNEIQATVRQMGHMSNTMLFDHYRGMTTTQEAAKYWEILPQKKLS
jgi:integrase